MTDGYVYFLRSYDRTRCKVGHSVNPYRRWGQLKSYYRDFEFVGYIPGSLELEGEFAEKFSQVAERLPGVCGFWQTWDWFSYNPEVEHIIGAITLLSLEDARKLNRELNCKQTRWDTPSKWKEQGK